MPIIKKAPEIITREIDLEQPVIELLEDYGQVHREQPRLRRQFSSEKGVVPGSGL